MRARDYLLSILLHVGVVVFVMGLNIAPRTRIDLSAPVYEVDLVSMEALKGAPGKKSEKKPEQAAETPKPKPAPEPPAPEPPAQETPPKVPETVALPETKPAPPKEEPKPAKPISPVKQKPKEEPKQAPEKKVDKTRPQPKPAKPKAPENTPEQLMAEALQSAQRTVAKQEKQKADAVNEALAGVKSEAASLPAPGEDGQGGTSEAGLKATYAQQVIQAIRPNWRYPKVGGRTVLECSVRIRLSETGVILGYQIVSRSAKSDFDASTINAIERTEVLPPPPSPELADLVLNFNIQDLAPVN